MYPILLLFSVLSSSLTGEVSYDDESNEYYDNYQILYKVYKNQKDKTITIIDSVTTIYGETSDKYAFCECKSIENIIFTPNSKLEVIQKFGFYSLTKLKSINLEVCSNLTKISGNAFAYSGLESINFPPSLKTIEGSAFNYNGKLTRVVIPKSVSSFGSCFTSCKKLSEIIFEDNIQITSFYDGTFTFANFSTFRVPASVTKFTPSSIWHCSNMETIEVEPNGHHVVDDGLLYTKNMENLIYCPDHFKNKTVYVRNGTKCIDMYAFHDCVIDEVILPNTVTSIQYEAFRWSDIKRIEMPDSITSLGRYVFGDCTSLEHIKISNNLKVIPECTFLNLNITNITIPNSVEEIGPSSFQGCSNLENFILPKNITSFGGGAFSDCVKINLTFAEGSPFSIDKQFLITRDNVTIICQYIGNTPDTTLYMPATVKRIMYKAFFKNKFITKIVCPEDSCLEYIDNSAFEESSISEFNFPPSLKGLGYCAFYLSGIKSVLLHNTTQDFSGGFCFSKCSQLTNVTFLSPSYNLTLGKCVFDSSPALTTVTLPEGLIEIKHGCFYGTSINSIELPSTVQTLGPLCFSQTHLITVTINTGGDPNQNSGAGRSSLQALTPSLTTISEKAFLQSTKLASFPFVEGIEYIGDFAFTNTALTKVVLPKSIVNITYKCFSECAKLEEVTTAEPSNLQYIGDCVFQNSLKMKSAICNNEYFSTIDTGLYTIDKTRIIFFPPKSPNKYLALPSKVVTIAPGSFTACTNLVLILFSDDSNLDFIGAEAFLNCTNLKSINLPEKSRVVGADAFKNCNQLECDLVISATNEKFLRNLVKIGNMPEKCLKPCKVCRTINPQYQMGHYTFRASLFTIIIGVSD